MFKLVVLSVLLAVAAAAPGYLGHSSVLFSAPAATVVHEPAFAKVGAIVKSYPTAVSHSSISQVHSSAHVVTPIVAPIVKTTAVVHSAPVLKTYVAPAPVSAPLHFAGPALSYGHGWAPSW
ncbi:retinin-like [Glossina fuscipes]|uniref:Retinin-like n=2 Tax=Nemorhina TaxID=44051 RepID=A0A9C5ZQ20_9MUSC|nr:retinin-like [Glossina fuscipes]KAI9587468.1 hypothetical protein GQX74_003314 [Glossina fuscipes]